jgi:hypothetical protein
MKQMITFSLLLLLSFLSATGQNNLARVNQAPSCNGCITYTDVLRIGNEDAEDLRAIRVFSDANGYNVHLIGNLSFKAKEVTTTLEKAARYYTVTPRGESLRIEPYNGATMGQVYELITTLLTGDYAFYFYMYAQRSARESKS